MVLASIHTSLVQYASISMHTSYEYYAYYYILATRRLDSRAGGEFAPIRMQIATH